MSEVNEYQFYRQKKHKNKHSHNKETTKTTDNSKRTNSNFFKPIRESRKPQQYSEAQGQKSVHNQSRQHSNIQSPSLDIFELSYNSRASQSSCHCMIDRTIKDQSSAPFQSSAVKGKMSTNRVMDSLDKNQSRTQTTTLNNYCKQKKYVLLKNSPPNKNNTFNRFQQHIQKKNSKQESRESDLQDQYFCLNAEKNNGHRTHDYEYHRYLKHKLKNSKRQIQTLKGQLANVDKKVEICQSIADINTKEANFLKAEFEYVKSVCHAKSYSEKNLNCQNGSSAHKHQRHRKKYLSRLKSQQNVELNPQHHGKISQSKSRKAQLRLAMDQIAPFDAHIQGLRRQVYVQKLKHQFAKSRLKDLQREYLLQKRQQDEYQFNLLAQRPQLLAHKQKHKKSMKDLIFYHSNNKRCHHKNKPSNLSHSQEKFKVGVFTNMSRQKCTHEESLHPCQRKNSKLSQCSDSKRKNACQNLLNSKQGFLNPSGFQIIDSGSQVQDFPRSSERQSSIEKTVRQFYQDSHSNAKDPCEEQCLSAQQRSKVQIFASSKNEGMSEKFKDLSIRETKVSSPIKKIQHAQEGQIQQHTLKPATKASLIKEKVNQTSSDSKLSQANNSKRNIQSKGYASGKPIRISTKNKKQKSRPSIKAQRNSLQSKVAEPTLFAEELETKQVISEFVSDPQESQLLL